LTPPTLGACCRLQSAPSTPLNRFILDLDRFA
jgi:hypothetical protein